MNILLAKYNNYMRLKASAELNERLREIKHVALDMDGTIYNGDTLFPYTIPFLNTLRKLNIGYSFLTNNPSKSTDDYIRHLNNMGVTASRDEIYTSAQATIKFLQINHPDIKRLFILGTDSMIKEFEEEGFVSTKDDPADIPDAVIVGFDKTLVYSRLSRAAWWISKGLFYLATNPDRVCPTDEPVVLLDCGAICSSLESATGRRPDIVIGKPDSRMLEGILQRHNLSSSQLAIIGDRLYTDLKMAFNTQTLGVLVLSGETNIEEAKHSEIIPDIIADDIKEFGQMLENANGGN